MMQKLFDPFAGAPVDEMGSILYTVGAEDLT